MNSTKRFFYSVISDSPKQIFKNIRYLERTNIGGIHFDVMDGSFVPRLGLYPELLSEIRNQSSLFIEVHAMLSTPSAFIEKFIEAGANRMMFHVETNDQINDLIIKTKELGIECGLVINPASKLESILPYLTHIESIMLMAINPGIPKHPFLDETYDKLSKLRNLLNEQNKDLEIVIDGGVTFENVEKLFALGANTLVCGSGTLFAPGNNLKKNFKHLKSII